MDILYAQGKATGPEVQQRLPEQPSYSTVRTILRILERKGYVTHDEINRAYVYRSIVARDEAANKDVGHVLRRFFAGKPVDLAMRLFERDRPSDEELRRLRALIERYEGES